MLYLKQGPSTLGKSCCMENSRNGYVPNSLKRGLNSWHPPEVNALYLNQGPSIIRNTERDFGRGFRPWIASSASGFGGYPRPRWIKITEGYLDGISYFIYRFQPSKMLKYVRTYQCQCTSLESGTFNPRCFMLHGKFKKWLCS